jgi:hypothetical protein
MKVEALVPCAIVQEFFHSSIFTMNSNETCAFGEQAMVELSIRESYSNDSKKVTDPTQIVNCFGVSYVMSNSLIGFGTRRSVIGGSVLKMQKSLKGTMLSNRHFCSLGNTHESSDIVTHELEQLAYSSNKNDRKGVDASVRRLITSQEF